MGHAKWTSIALDHQHAADIRQQKLGHRAGRLMSSVHSEHWKGEATHKQSLVLHALLTSVTSMTRCCAPSVYTAAENSNSMNESNV